MRIRTCLSSDGVDTLQESLVGLAAGFAVAFLAAVAMSEVPLFERALMPLAVVVNVTPLVAIAPGLGIAFGFGYAPKYILTAIIVFFPFLVNACHRAPLGRARGAERLRDACMPRASRCSGGSGFPPACPSCSPRPASALPLSIVGAVVAEFTASGFSRGLGYLVAGRASDDSQLALEFAAIFCLAVMGIVYTALVASAEHRLLRWHVSARSPRN